MERCPQVEKNVTWQREKRKKEDCMKTGIERVREAGTGEDGEAGKGMEKGKSRALSSPRGCGRVTRKQYYKIIF